VCVCGQVSSPLIRRVTQVDTRFVKELEFEPRVAADFDFQLDTDAVLHAIGHLDFFELKGKLPYKHLTSPHLIPIEECMQLPTGRGCPGELTLHLPSHGQSGV